MLVGLTTYGVGLIDADHALCFGRDGHTGIEGSSEHHGSVPGADSGLVASGGHGPCVDVLISATGHGASQPAPMIAVVTRPAVAIVRRDPSPVPRRDGRPLDPPAGFGSVLLRI